MSQAFQERARGDYPADRADVFASLVDVPEAEGTGDTLKFGGSSVDEDAIASSIS